MLFSSKRILLNITNRGGPLRVQSASASPGRASERKTSDLVREQRRFGNHLYEMRKKHQKFLTDAREKMGEETEQLKRDMATARANIMLKGQDGFYRIERLRPTIEDMGEAYVLSLNIPKHEVDQVSLSAHGRRIKLTASRRFEGKIMPAYGESHHTRRSEVHTREFPTKDIVASDSILRHYKDGVLSFKILKA